MKVRLNIEALNNDFFDGTRLLGITAPIKNYLFCWQINLYLGFDFRLNTDIEIKLIKNNRNYHFSIYQSFEKNSFLVHYLYHNHCDGEYLLPEFKHIDYLWLMKGDLIDDEKVQWILQSLKSMACVQLISELTNEKIITKGNMVFE